MNVTDPSQERTLTRFLVVALGLGLGLQIPALFNPAFLGLGIVVMWVPALAVVLSGASGRRTARQSLARPWPWKMMLAASVLGWFEKAICGLVSVATGAATFDSAHFAIAGWRVTHADFLWFFPQSGEALPLFLVHMFTMQLVGVAIVAPLLAFGEEIGWRGLLQPELVKRWGVGKGTLAVGVIWAYWHVGFMLAGHNAGGSHVVLNALVLFPFQLIVVSFLYAWFVVRTGSVLPAICAHAANNSFPDDKLFTTTSWTGEKAVSVLTTLALAALVYAMFRISPPKVARAVPG